MTYSDVEKKLNSRFPDGFLELKDLPQPKMLKDMEKAAKRIKQAIDKKEKMVVVGDYDVDGIGSTVIMKSFFDEIGVDVPYIVPNRFRDGYGLSPNLIPRIKDLGATLVITVDNGISAMDAARLCQKEGIDLIITDHHLLPPEIPPAYAIINQKQQDCTFPYSDICGAQIAWYLVAQLRKELGREDIRLSKYLEIAAISTIADMMPLKHINRTMVKAGLKLLGKSERPAIKAFREMKEKSEISSEDIAFFLAPAMNSAGRLYDAEYAIEFLLSKDMDTARKKLYQLIDFNDERKEIENRIVMSAKDKVSPEDSFIIIAGEDWHEGVLGIAAARVGRDESKPCIILSQSDDPNILKGSGRSFTDIDIYGVVTECRDLLEKFGGHAAAIGLSLKKENFEEFRKRANELAASGKFKKEPEESKVIGEIPLSMAGYEMLNIIRKFEPFGQENPMPMFESKKVKILSVNKMGKEGNHLRFSFLQDGAVVNGVKFKTFEEFEDGDIVDIVYSISENIFRGNSSIQLIIEEVKKN